jgi:flagellum-specific ATP synthase
VIDTAGLMRAVDGARVIRSSGRVVEVVGTLVEAELPGASVGGLCTIGSSITCQVVGFRGHRALLMPFEPVRGVSYGSRVRLLSGDIRVGVGDALVGRVLDALGRPIDGGPPPRVAHTRAVDSAPPEAMRRQIITQPLTTGVRVLDGLLTLGKGQRVSLMAGSGVGKSTLMGMIARGVKADVNVICLVGERGREVREFVERDLGPEGLARSVVIVATSDRSPVLQVKAASTACTVAESFRDRGMDVVLMMDSVTRFAMAQRQIGLAAGEPPTTKGYTPSVFNALPGLLERAGPGVEGQGSITGIYTVLIEGDDIHDPIGDAVRGIVDGPVVLSRKLASHGHYPAVDVLPSLSRVMRAVVQPEHLKVAARARDLLATWAENEELVRLGAYRKGTSAAVDEAIARYPQIVEVLRQRVEEPSELEVTIAGLAAACGVK